MSKDAKTMTNSERGKKAAAERWHPSMPKATHSGILVIGSTEMACDVLEDGRRILRHSTFAKAMGKSVANTEDRERANRLQIPLFIGSNNLIPFLQPDILERGKLIVYKSIEGRKCMGYEATLLPEACKVYVQADDAGKLLDRQKSVAKVCRSMLYGLATVGIISLIDDATRYVEQRNRNELQLILEKYISEDLRPWVKKFPDEFFRQAYKIHGWEYEKLKKHHPQCLGNFINRYIYEKLPPGVLEELKSKNPVKETGNRSFRHHQFLTEDIGNDNLKKQIGQVITLMKISDSVDQFKEFVEKISD